MARGNTLAHLVPENRYTSAQVARHAGVSVQTVRRWFKKGILVPRVEPLKVGKVRITLYTRYDLTKAKRLAGRTGVLVDRLL